MKKNRFKGKLIVIDGIDGSGKATQTKLLLERMKKEGYKTATIDFPQYYKNFFGKAVGKYLSGKFGSADKISPYLASILYALDRWESKNFIINQLNKEKIFICNRYSSANMIHQGGKIKQKKEKKEFVKWLEKMEFDVFKIPKPDLVVYLDVPCGIGQKLVGKKNIRKYTDGKKMDMHEKDRNHLSNARLQALELARQNKNWIKINCIKNNKLLSIKEINDLIWDKLKEYNVFS